MTASHTTVHAVCEIVRKRVSEQQFKNILRDLLSIPGSSSIRETIRRMASKLGVE